MPGVFSLGRWSSQFPTGFLVSRGTRDVSGRPQPFAYGTVTLCGGAFQRTWARSGFSYSPGGLQTTPDTPTTPYGQRLQPSIRRVWALPHSLAATRGITVVFSSSGYLDVSVPPVPLRTLCIQIRMPAHYRRRVSPFGYPRIKACLRLPEAYRSLPRPSSAPWHQGIHRVPLLA